MTPWLAVWLTLASPKFSEMCRDKCSAVGFFRDTRIEDDRLRGGMVRCFCRRMLLEPHGEMPEEEIMLYNPNGANDGC